MSGPRVALMLVALTAVGCGSWDRIREEMVGPLHEMLHEAYPRALGRKDLQQVEQDRAQLVSRGWQPDGWQPDEERFEPPGSPRCATGGAAVAVRWGAKCGECMDFVAGAGAEYSKQPTKGIRIWPESARCISSCAFPPSFIRSGILMF